MNTIELAYQPFEQLSGVVSSGNQRAWIIVVVILIVFGGVYLYAKYGKEELSEVATD
jgi:hypothetical protein